MNKICSTIIYVLVIITTLYAGEFDSIKQLNNQFTENIAELPAALKGFYRLSREETYNFNGTVAQRDHKTLIEDDILYYFGRDKYVMFAGDEDEIIEKYDSIISTGKNHKFMTIGKKKIPGDWYRLESVVFRVYYISMQKDLLWVVSGTEDRKIKVEKFERIEPLKFHSKELNESEFK